MKFCDGAIDAGGEAEVIGVDDERHKTGYREQGAGCRDGDQGLVISCRSRRWRG
jgi:hypothetical protein